MKTTLNLDPGLMARLKRVAAEQGKTMTELVESALRRLLQERPRAATDLPPLPSFDCGSPLVDVSNRDDLYRAMEGR